MGNGWLWTRLGQVWFKTQNTPQLNFAQTLHSDIVVLFQGIFWGRLGKILLITYSFFSLYLLIRESSTIIIKRRKKEKVYDVFQLHSIYIC